MDIQMPVLNGYEAAALFQFNKDVIIIAQTAFGTSSKAFERANLRAAMITFQNYQKREFIRINTKVFQ
jgi:CheY-like chemotaxis protein